MLRTLDKWHKSRAGLMVFALVEFAIAYGFVSLAIDRGNVLYYLLALIFFVGTLQNFIKLIGSFNNGKPKARSAGRR